MECDTKNTRPGPVSIRELLRKQVDEQSELCDVTIKVGSWEKKFHWFVLVQSPFFDVLYKANFIERQNDMVDIHIATPNTVEYALMFLYGRMPRFTDDNVRRLLELAEFLLISNLKSSCYQWLKSRDISSDNCIDICELCSIYEFEHEQCIVYILAHLHELFNDDNMLKITKESIVSILKDETLSYVSTEQRFSFITKWTACLPVRHQHFEELFDLIDLRNVSEDFCQSHICCSPLVRSSEHCKGKLVNCETISRDQLTSVLLPFPPQYPSGIKNILCFDSTELKWYRLPTEMVVSNCSDAASNSEKVFTFKEYPYKLLIMHIVNELPVSCKEKTVNNYFDAANSPLGKFDHVLVVAGNCYFASSQGQCISLTYENQVQSDDDLAMLRSSIALRDFSVETMIAQIRLAQSTNMTTETKYIVTSTIYEQIGENEECVYVRPLLSLKSKIECICSTRGGEICFLGDKEIFVFNTVTKTMDSIDVTSLNMKPDKRGRLSPIVDGFLLYYGNEAIQFTPVQGPALVNRWKTRNIHIDASEETMQKSKRADMDYTCEICETRFSKLSQLLQHRRTENHWEKFPCETCGKVFSRKNNLVQHMKKHTTASNIHCDECGQVFSRKFTLDRHKERGHQVGAGRKRQNDGNDDHPIIKKLRQNDDPRRFYTLNKISEKKIKTFGTSATTYNVQFRELEVVDIPDILKTLKRLFGAIIEDLTLKGKPHDLMRMTIECPTLDYPIIIPFGQFRHLTADTILAEIERVLQSNEDFVLDAGLKLEVTHVDMPNGGAGKRCKYVNSDKFVLEKRCIIRIQNQDELCCARALVTAKARLEKHEKWNSIRQGRDIQRTLAEQLHISANVPLEKCGIPEIKQFQGCLQDYQINVVSMEHFNAIIFSGPEKDNKLYLYNNDDHYDVITSMPAFLARVYYCTKCQKGYSNKEEHKCNKKCLACMKIHEEHSDKRILCNSCNRYFKGQECFSLHQRMTKNGSSTCSTFYRCQDCGSTVNKKRKHEQHFCGEIYCKLCDGHFPTDHKCYMLPEETEDIPMSIDEELIAEHENVNTYIFFDLECTQDDMLQCDDGYEADSAGKCVNCGKSSCGGFEHKPNLCVVHKVCTQCMDIDVTEGSECVNCGKNERVFRGDNTVNEFCLWLFSETNYKSTVICHNFQGYDSYPILRYLCQNGILPSVIPNGAKIMSLTVPACKIRMIDSLNFLPMSLSKLPSMFGFDELVKGYFPHLFNRKDNQMTILSHLPPLNNYNPDGMKPDDRDAFLQWYECNKNNAFNFQNELLRYCRSDVDILRRCCLRFRENFMDITNIDPFEKCITIASACHLVFRTNFLQNDTIGIIPAHGYNPQHVQSVKALQWIKYISHVKGIRIQHARNGGEKVIGLYQVDGYYETNDGQKVVLEFHGDFWHGNPKKYASSTINPVNKMTMSELYQKTMEKQTYIEQQGYIYQSIWESEFDLQLSESTDMATFVHNLDMVSSLKPRDAFYGGRTEAFTLYKEATEQERLNYYDVTSLYPYINKTGKIPLGHPQIITEDFYDLDNYEGLIKCKIVPPRELFIPVLPCRSNGKLMFALCNTCAKTRQQNPCNHTDEERSFLGTWVTDEVKKAVAKGYVVKRIYEVWHFDEVSEYDPDTMEGGVFKEYVNTFLKLKQESSGWPSWCTTEEQKQEYIRLYNEKEGIQLDYEQIKKNKGMRALAKLMLNSFWGKFGQRLNMSQVEYVDDPGIFFDKLSSDSEEITGVNFVSDDMVEMRWRFRDDLVETSGKVNVVIAAYTTAQARLKLYSYLENLGRRALYADTDSIVFSTKYGEWQPDLGDYLGDLTDEIPDNNIKTFVTGGPKNYAYQTEHPDETGKITHCKIRGITLNHKNNLQINFDIIKKMVATNSKDSVTLTDSCRITRDRDSATIMTVSQDKDYRLVFDKRVLREPYVSYPYGY